MGIKRTQLKDVLADQNTSRVAQQYLESFECCSRDSESSKPHDVQNWLHNQAINFEKLGRSRTYLLIDSHNDSLVAYFALAQKILTFGDSATLSSKLKHLCGIRSDTSNPQVPCILLAQLGKNDKAGDSLHFAQILDECLAVLKNVNELIGGNILLVECDRNKKLRGVYESCGFKHIQDVETPSGEILHQLYKILKFKTIAED